MKYLSIVKMDNYGGTKHTGIPVKTLKKILKKAGLKVSGKKATLTRRAKRAKLFGGETFREKQLANRSNVNKMLGDFGVSSQYKQAERDAADARALAKKNNDMATANAVEVQNEAIQKNIEEIKRSTPSYGYFFKGGKKKRSRRS